MGYEANGIHKNGISDNTKKYITAAYLLIFSFILCLLSRQCAFYSLVPGTDSSVFMTIAKGMTTGKVPYLNFFDHKGPFLYLINFLGYSIGGVRGVWIFEIIFIAVAVFFSYATMKKLCGRMIALCSTTAGFLMLVLCLDGGNLTEEYALPLISIALYISVSIILSERSSAWQALAMGFTFGLSLMLRPNMFAVWFIFSAYWVISCLVKKNFGTAIKYILFFVLGTIVALLPFMIYLWYNNALSDYIYQNFTFNSQYAQYTGRSSTFGNIIKVLFSYASMALVALASCIVGIFSQKNRKILFVLLLLSMVLSIALISISNTIYTHYYMVFVPIVVIAVSALFVLLKKALSKRGHGNKWTYFVVAGITVCLICAVGLLSWASNKSNSEATLRKGTTALSEKLNECASEGETLQVLGNMCQFYLFTDVKPAGKFIYDQPIANISPDVHEQFAKEWTENKPTYVIAGRSFITDGSKGTEHNKWIVHELENDYTELFSAEKYVIYQYAK